MKVMAAVVFTSLLLSACGTATGDRGLSGAGIGAGIGYSVARQAWSSAARSAPPSAW
jgi:hypothetical protein